jgi:hypothetical protein
MWPAGSRSNAIHCPANPGDKPDKPLLKRTIQKHGVSHKPRTYSEAAAMDLARRIRALGEQVKSDSSPVTALKAKIKAALDNARSDPEVSQQLGLFGFIQKAVANLKAQESDAEGAA